MTEAFIYDAVRTPRGRGKPDGALHEVTSLFLASRALAAIADPAALIDRRSTASGKVSRRHERPSVDSNTVPDRPINQQTDGDGDAPATSVSAAPVASVRQVAPPSSVRKAPAAEMAT